MTKNRNFILMCCLSVFSLAANGQSSTTKLIDFAHKLNTITTSVPFLSITPDARAGGMGDAGVAVSQDANSAFGMPQSWLLPIRKDHLLLMGLLGLGHW